MIRLKPPQWAVFNCPSRFRILLPTTLYEAMAWTS